MRKEEKLRKDGPLPDAEAPAESGLTGREAAEKILKWAGLSGAPVQESGAPDAGKNGTPEEDAVVLNKETAASWSVSALVSAGMACGLFMLNADSPGLAHVHAGME